MLNGDEISKLNRYIGKKDFNGAFLKSVQESNLDIIRLFIKSKLPEKSQVEAAISIAKEINESSPVFSFLNREISTYLPVTDYPENRVITSFFGSDSQHSMFSTGMRGGFSFLSWKNIRNAKDPATVGELAKEGILKNILSYNDKWTTAERLMIQGMNKLHVKGVPLSSCIIKKVITQGPGFSYNPDVNIIGKKALGNLDVQAFLYKFILELPESNPYENNILVNKNFEVSIAIGANLEHWKSLFTKNKTSNKVSGSMDLEHNMSINVFVYGVPISCTLGSNNTDYQLEFLQNEKKYSKLFKEKMMQERILKISNEINGINENNIDKYANFLSPKKDDDDEKARRRAWLYLSNDKAVSPYNNFNSYSSLTTPENTSMDQKGFLHEPVNNFSLLDNKHQNLFNFTTKRNELESFYLGQSRLGNQFDQELPQFTSILNQTRLVDSYNICNPEANIPKFYSFSNSDIGGVAVKQAEIIGMKNNLGEFNFNSYSFCFESLKDIGPPCNNLELQQILRELTIGIYLHNALPFFSLHGNREHNLYPVIHPCYKNTLVGKTIGYLDYFMKGFLNGYIYTEEFIEKWKSKPYYEAKKLMQNVINLAEYCKTHNILYDTTIFDLFSVKFPNCEGIEVNEGVDALLERVNIVFRIIANKCVVQKHENIFVIKKSDFYVEYDIIPKPMYLKYMQKHLKEKGKLPPDYQKIMQLCEKDKKNIEEVMVKLPLFAKYFKMLGVINFFTNYLYTLKKMNKEPKLTKLIAPYPFQFPNSLPGIAYCSIKKQNVKHIITGGCGVSINNIYPQSIPTANILKEKLFCFKTDQNEKFNKIVVGNKTYYAFNLPVKDNFAYSNLDHLNIAESLKYDNNVEMGINEIKAFIEIQECFLYSRTCTKNLKYNLNLKDNSGKTLIHYFASFANAAFFEQFSDMKDTFLVTDQHGNFPVHIAAKHGNANALEFFLSQNKEHANVINNFAESSLIIAAINGKEKAISVLLKHGANVNYQMPNGFFALYLAIQNGHFRTALYIIEHAENLDLNLKAENHMSPLLLAIDNKASEIAVAIINRNNNTLVTNQKNYYTPYHLAAKRGLVEVCDAILKTSKVRVNTPVASNETALHYAVKGGNLKLTKLLVENFSANIDALTNDFYTPLMSAIVNGNIEQAYYLAQKCKINKFEQDVNTQLFKINSKKETALLQAAKLKLFGIADVLINRGEDPFQLDLDGYNYIYYLIKNGEYHRYKFIASKYNVDHNTLYNGDSSLKLAIKYGHNNLARFLLLNKAEFKSSENNGWKMIHYAVKSDNLGYLTKWIKQQDMLLGSKEKVFLSGTIKTGIDSSKTLAYIAAENKSLRCLKQFFEYDPDLSLKNAFLDRHLLYAAVVSNCEKVFNFVLQKSKDINLIVDKYKNTPLHLAVEFGYLDLTKIILNYGGNVKYKNFYGQTCFDILIQNENLELLKKLLEMTSKKLRPKGLVSQALSYEKNKHAMEIYKIYPEMTNANCLINTVLNSHGAMQFIELYLFRNKFNNITDILTKTIIKAIKEGNYQVVKILLEYDNSYWNKCKYDPQTLKELMQLAINTNNISIFRCFDVHLKNIKLTVDAFWGSFRNNLDNFYITNALKRNYEAFDADKKLLIKLLYACSIHQQNNTPEIELKKIIEIKKFPYANELFLLENIELPLLHWSIKLNVSWVMHFLLINNVNILARDTKGKNILYHVFLHEDKIVEEQLTVLGKFVKPEVLLELFICKDDYNSSAFQMAIDLQKYNVFFKYLLDSSMSLEHRTVDHYNLLHIAVSCQDVDVVKTLIQKIEIQYDKDKVSKFINEGNRLGTTPFMMAVRNENLPIMKLFILYNVSFGLTNIKQETALHIALKFEKLKSSRFLLQHIGDKRILCKHNQNNDTPFFVATEKGLLPMVKLLANFALNKNQVNRNGFTAMHIAAFFGHSRVITFLAEIGYDVNIKSLKCKKNMQEYTPLEIAAISNKENAFTALFKLCDINLVKKEKETLANYAVLHSSNKIINCLERLKMLNFINVNEKCFFSACKTGNEYILKRLLLARCNINIQERAFGFTGLHFAVMNNQNKVVSILIDQGILINVKTLEGNTALHIAAEKGFLDISLQLLINGANVNLLNNENETPLHLAVINNQYSIIKLLLLYNADSTLTNKQGELPQDLARKYNFTSSYDLLQRYSNAFTQHKKEIQIGLKRYGYEKSIVDNNDEQLRLEENTLSKNKILLI